MLTREDWIMIQDRVRKGVYLKDIAHELGVHPRTVRRALDRDGAPSRRRRRAKFVKLTPFMDRIDELLSEDVWNAVVIYRDIQARGYTGRLTALRDYIRPKRELRPSKATVRFETAPGKQLQHDWGRVRTEIAGVTRTAHLAINTLGYSRRFHVFGAPCEDAEHTYESLVRAFSWFGGVPAEVVVDNQRAAVIEHRYGRRVRFNPRFLDLAAHYGFKPWPCQPGRARTKGKVERMVAYVKDHFFQRYRAFESFAHLNQQLEAWLIDEADQRLHGTYKRPVAERFAEERPLLQPLPAVAFDTSYIEPRTVGWDAYVAVAGNRYSVPAAYVAQPVTVYRSLDGRIRIHAADGALIASHSQRPAQAGWATVPEHHRRLWQDLKVQHRSLAAYEPEVS